MNLAISKLKFEISILQGFKKSKQVEERIADYEKAIAVLVEASKKIEPMTVDNFMQAINEKDCSNL